MPELNLDKILASLDLRISEVTLPDEYDQISKDYLGKDSLLAEERKKLPTLSNEDKKTYGKKLTELSKKIESKIASSKKQFILDTFQKKEKDEFTDITIDWNRNEGSYKHILSSVMDEVVNIFSSIGYEVAYGPEAETSWHNFDALNTPDWHPARYESDTIYLNSDLETLLRTQTSTVQIRHMEQNDPPVYIVAPGRVFRSDQLDATHSPVFHQLEGLAIDKNLSFTDLKGTLEYFTKEFFGENIDVIISDMAADTTGNKSLDCIRTNQLCADVINFSTKTLKPNGVLVTKSFMGEDFLEIKRLAKEKFKIVQFFKPESSRNESKETYLHCAILKTL